MGPVNELLQKAGDFIEKGVFSEAFHIASAIAPQCINAIEEIDDSDGECGGAIDDAFRITKDILGKSDDEKLKKEVYKWVLQQMDNPDYNNYGCSEVLEEVVLTSAPTAEEIAMAHETINQQIAKAAEGEGWSKQFYLKKYLQYKIQLLTKEGKSSETGKIIDDNLHISEFREIRVNEQVAANNLDKAIDLILEGITIAEKENLSGTVKEWKEKLLSVYEQLNDIEHIRKTASDLFFSSRYDIKFYRILKKAYPTYDWLTEREKIITLLSSESFSGYILSNIFIEEKLWNKLFELVKKGPGTDALMNYSKYLKKDYSAELIEMFKLVLRKFTERNTGRGAYISLAGYLKEMATLNGGLPAAKALKAELLATYKNRPALKRELSNLWNE